MIGPPWLEECGTRAAWLRSVEDLVQRKINGRNSFDRTEHDDSMDVKKGTNRKGSQQCEESGRGSLRGDSMLRCSCYDCGGIGWDLNM